MVRISADNFLSAVVNRRTQLPVHLEVCDFSNHKISVERWQDPVVDVAGFEIFSEYFETYWLGVIGPSATWVMRYLGRELDLSDCTVTVNLVDMATILGLGFRHGSGSLERAIQRCATFGLISPSSTGLAVRKRVPTISKRHLARLPLRLQNSHYSLLLARVN